MAPEYPSSPMIHRIQVPGRKCSGRCTVAPEHPSPPTTRRATTMPAAANPTFDTVRIGIVSVSDRASGGVYEDKGLPALKDWLGRALRNPLAFDARLIPDEQATISATTSPIAASSIRRSRAQATPEKMRKK